MPKKGKKGKGKNSKKLVLEDRQPFTTVQIIQDRTKMLCPRIGDFYSRALNVEGILEDIVHNYLKKISSKQSNCLSLSSMKMKFFPDISNQISHLQCLTSLNLSKNNLFNGEELFMGLCQLEQLTQLNLSENFLNGPLSVHAGKLSRLEVINLDINNITALCPEVCNWTALRIFTISDNSLGGLPPEASAWSEVNVVNVKNNKVRDIGNLPGFWLELTRLYLGSNLLTSIPFEIGHCAKLKEADFSCNVIQTLPLSLGNCTSLERLHLGSNKIEYLPPEIFFPLQALKELYLYKNKIGQVPPEIGNLTAIKKLSLASNNLRGLPDEIASCTTLEELYLSNNAKFSYFPGGAGHLRKLKELSLAKCPALKQMPSSTSDMISLRELDIRSGKKQACRVTPELVAALSQRFCKVRGGVIKKAKGPGKKNV
mmetsp:Transcript_16596/g.33667  ORF Transcript_16596/g.33667 Transcript_16596/m.33667 type:complete len:427 (+) Transcript_16596:20-1300(+)